MPSKSKKQARLMAAVAHNAEFAAKVGIPQSVGREFHVADKRVGRYAGGGKVKSVQDLRTALENWKVNKLPQEGFFSTLDELIANAPFEQMPAFQWQKYLQPGRELEREGIKFPLKKEEIEYGNLANLDKPGFGDLLGTENHGPDTLLTKDQVRDFVRRHRPGVELDVQTMAADPDLDDFLARRGYGTHAEQLVDVNRIPSYDSDQLRHPSSRPTAYEENITSSRDLRPYESHFSPWDISWSRTTRHEVSPRVAGLPNDQPNPTFRLIEEIQSDRHSKAGEKVFKSTPEYEQAVQALMNKYPGTPRSYWESFKDLDSLMNEHGRVSMEEPVFQDFAEAIKKSQQRRGYRTEGDDQELLALDSELGGLLKKRADDNAEYRHRFENQGREGGFQSQAEKEAFQQQLYATADRLQVVQDRLRRLKATPPDAPFKDPRDYATLETRKQLLNATRENDSFLGMITGTDQIDRYEGGMGPREAAGMHKMYDELYPSVLKKEAGRYGAETRPVPVNTMSARDVRPNTFVEWNAENFDDYLENMGEFDNRSDLQGRIGSMRRLANEFEYALRENPDYSDRKQAFADLAKIREQLNKGSEDVFNWVYEPGEGGGFHAQEWPDLFGQGGALHRMESFYRDRWDDLKGVRATESIKNFPAAHLTPEVRDKIRRIGVPIFSAAGAAALGYDMSSEDQGDQPAFAEGGAVDPIQFGPDTKWADDPDQAALAAFAALQAAQASEQAGLLFKNKEGKYAYTPAVQGRRDDFTVRAAYDPDVLDLIGSYHTHPDGPDSHVFSTHDVDTARTLKLLSYIMDKAGKVHRFDPKTSRVRQSGERRLGNQRQQTALGDLVIPKGDVAMAQYAEGGEVSKTKKAAMDYWRAVADSMGNAVPFTSDDTRKRLSDVMARPLSGFASQVMTRDPSTGELYFGGRPGLVDEFQALPTLYEDATGFLMNNMGGREFAQGMSGADPETMDLTQKLLFSAPQFAHDAQERTVANYDSARRGMGLNEPHGFGENTLEAAGVMAGQLPVPGSLVRRLKALSKSRPALNAARKVIGPAVEWLSPTIDPKPGNYLKGALFGGALGGASDTVTDYLDKKKQEQFIREAISQVLAEGGDSDEQLDAAVDEAAGHQGYAEGGKVSKARQALKALKEGMRAIDISPDRMYSIGSPREEILYSLNEGQRTGVISPAEAAAFKQQLAEGDPEKTADVLLSIQQRLHPVNVQLPPLAPAANTPERRAPLSPSELLFKPGELPHERLNRDLGPQTYFLPVPEGGGRGRMSDEDFERVLRGEKVGFADGGPVVTGPVDYEHYGETGPEHMFFGDRRMPALPPGWKPAPQAAPRPVSSGGGSTAGSIASGLGTVLALGRDARQAGNLYGSARDLYNRIFGDTPHQAQGISDQGASDFSGTNADIASDLSNLPIPELAGAAGAGAAGLGALGAGAVPAGTVTITEGGLAGLGALGGEAAGAGAAGAAGAGAAGAEGALAGTGAIGGGTGALGGGASADAIGGAAAGAGGWGLAAGLGLAALPAAIFLAGGLGNNRTERNALALQQSGLEQLQLAGGQRVLMRPDGKFIPFNDEVMNNIRERWGVIPENEFWDWANSQPTVEGQINRIPAQVRNQPLTESSRGALEQAGLWNPNPGTNAKAGRRQKD